jgi:hypothetical protein
MDLPLNCRGIQRFELSIGASVSYIKYYTPLRNLTADWALDAIIETFVVHLPQLRIVMF